MQRSPRAGGGGRVRSRSRRRAEPVRRTRSSPQQLHDQLQRAVLGQEAVDTLSLLQRGADPNLRVTAPHIRTPRSLPSSRKEKTIKILNPSKGPRFRHDNSWSIRDPEAGADNYAFWHTEHRDKGARMETLLHRAARDGKAELVRALLDHGADASERDWAQRTPLHVAAAADTPGEVLQLLLRAPGTLIDAQDAAGDTALHCALRQKNRRNTILLLEAGARADIRNKGGRTALKHLLKDFPQALETAFDRSLRLVRPLGWSGRAIQFDYSLFNPCLLDDDESSYVSCMETRLLNSIEVEATRDQLFLHPLCQSFLNLKWKMISPLYVIDIIIFFVFVVSFNVFLFAVVDKRRAENITDSAPNQQRHGVLQHV
ncbi:Transient receptor potential channel pyrexia [Amphibalanus amphitrite]|uniref:Transient receptor potential channel pyrexia n=1 Tax=Amphibalanus amphitrite TaxID=1232801 RepID=A0A6A4WDQ1_AMPAM|nr:Transient receptor potential channel pyrexia [Amphibalanus amphitrite]